MSKINNISVALATFNGELYIKAQIDSLLNQTTLPNEIIIVDDLSTDKTIQIIDELKKEYPIIKYYINKRNVGPVESFKIAISKCTFTYVALCDQDDIWDKNKLLISLLKLKEIEQNQKPCMVFSDLRLIDKNNNIVYSSFWKLQKFNPFNVNFRDILIGNVATGCTIMMNNYMKKEIDKMPNNVTMHDHWIAIIAFGIGNYNIINEKLVNYRIHENSVTLKLRLSYIQRLKMVLNTFLDSNNLYLSKNLNQAKLFYTMYKEVLGQNEKKILNKFVSLEKKKSYMRKLYVGYYKYVIKKMC